MNRHLARACGALLCLLALTASCSDDVVEPLGKDPQQWTEVDLQAPEADIQLLAVAAGGGQVATIGWQAGIVPDKDLPASSILFRRQPDDSWTHQIPAPGSPEATWLDLAFDDQGGLLLAGWDSSALQDGACVLDTRSGQERRFCFPGLGLLTLTGAGDVFVAGGGSQGGLLVTSTAVDSWSAEDLPLTGVNDSGIKDADIRGSVSVACGFDDGADLLAVLLRREGAGAWQKLELDAELFFGRTLQAVALTDDGDILAGGIDGAGSPSPRAFLTVLSPAGQGSDIILPDPDRLGGVNDILVVADGSYFVACSGESDLGFCQILHITAAVITKGIDPFKGRILNLAQAGDGTLYASGFESRESLQRRPVLLRRDP